jgi:hypothetical protein
VLYVSLKKVKHVHESQTHPGLTERVQLAPTKTLVMKLKRLDMKTK